MISGLFRDVNFETCYITLRKSSISLSVQALYLLLLKKKKQMGKCATFQYLQQHSGKLTIAHFILLISFCYHTTFMFLSEMYQGLTVDCFRKNKIIKKNESVRKLLPVFPQSLYATFRKTFLFQFLFYLLLVSIFHIKKITDLDQQLLLSSTLSLIKEEATFLPQFSLVNSPS